MTSSCGRCRPVNTPNIASKPLPCAFARLGLLPHNPPPQPFGPTYRNPWMPPIEAIQWLWKVGAVPSGDVLGCEDLLDAALRNGEIVASGLFKGNLNRRRVPSKIWQDHRADLTEPAGTRFVKRDPGRPNIVELLRDGDWRSIMYRRSDVLRIGSAIQQSTIPLRYRTGAAGRPSSMHLIRDELERRKAAGEKWPGKNQCANELRAWLAKNHPDAPQPGNKTLLNSLRDSIPTA